MEPALAFYREILGSDVVFDVELAGETLDSVTGEAGASGRMVGGLLGGTSVELLEISSTADSPVARSGPMLGYTNISLSVDDLDAARDKAASAGVAPGSIVSIGGVRMFFVTDPDGTPIEIIEYPNGATTSAGMWRPETEI
ncbi:MAG: glyoxylase family protein [Actinomycetota bacterium]|jgi:glyoxylase I family protein|nr:glyoxylase family protein [Actinomycetota bacterium]